MSTGAQIAVLPPVGTPADRARARAAPAERPLMRLAAVGALGLYGILRWATMLSPAPIGRLLELLALCLGLVAIGAARPLLGRGVVALAAVLAFFAMFAMSGVPLAWVVHLRIAVSTSWIAGGISALPGVLVPYSGLNEWVRVVVVLGAGLLLLAGGLSLAFVPRGVGDLRRAGAALPLVALAVIPSTLLRPQVPYLQGLILFALLAFFMWGERVRRDDLAALIALGAVVGAAAMILAPRLDPRQPWVDPHSLANSFSPAHLDTFDWSQRYGPLNWPRTGHEVLDVKPSQAPDYWKAEDLDTFNGFGWVADNVEQQSLPPADPESLRRWTQTIQVTLHGMRTNDVIAAGYAFSPAHIQGTVTSGAGAGTWVSPTPLRQGASYSVRVYTPHPSSSQLAAAYDGAGSGDFPLTALEGFLTLTMPQSAASPRLPQRVLFPPFGSHAAPLNVGASISESGARAIARSPYAPAYALARRLARGAETPYAYVRRVLQYLSVANGFQYNEDTPATAHPLATFLRTKQGYCQQFAGTMALLLRMGGVPARVATGFTTGTYDSSSHSYVVTDIDAHSWVEAWFPHYGWVRFDPTPAAAPARGGHTAISSSLSVGRVAPVPLAPRRAIGPTGPVAASTTASGGGPSAVLIGLLAALAALFVVALVATRGVANPTDEQLLAELERALARSGRPLAAGSTLAELEHRFRTSADAAAYVRAIRTIRFAGGGPGPTRHQRRALRAHLRAGLGLGGRVRALWALPPRWTVPQRLRSRDGSDA